MAKGKFKLKHNINYILVGLFLIITAVIFFAGGMRRSTANLMAQISYSIILAVSLNLVVGFLGELSLGHAGFMCVGAYIGGYCSLKLSALLGAGILPLILSMLIGGVVAAIFGFIIGLPALRLKGDYLAIVTLAFGEIVRTISYNIEGFGGTMGLPTKRYGQELFIIALIVVLIMLFVIQNLIRSKHGRAITAIRDNEIAAKAMGINVTFYKLLVFVIAAFFAGIAGVIYAHYTTPVLYSFFSYNYSIEILVMVVLGGMGSITGSIIAAILITCINFVLTTSLSGDLAALKLLIYAVILIAMIIYNNAPALAPIKDKVSKFKDRIINIFTGKLFKKKYDPSKIYDDHAQWHRIPSKIKMDAILSVDIDDKNSGNMNGGDKK
ncbi:MAG: branched-chain amino acid ABC transporter permease [Clostridia bacterium]|nr:branched-chain amino acid ABC transporter permease [Clostridia bacterium]